MPKQSKKETPKQQAERFRAEVERLIEAGELSPTEADAALDNMVRISANKREDHAGGT